MRLRHQRLNIRRQIRPSVIDEHHGSERKAISANAGICKIAHVVALTLIDS
jgi:hypothetical protein